MLKLNRIVLSTCRLHQNVSYSMYKHFCKHKLLTRTSSKVLVRNKKSNTTNLFVPVHVKPNTDPTDANVGQELTGGSIDKSEMVKILNKFYQRQEIKIAAMDHGLDSKCSLEIVLHCGWYYVRLASKIWVLLTRTSQVWKWEILCGIVDGFLFRAISKQRNMKGRLCELPKAKYFLDSVSW